VLLCASLCRRSGLPLLHGLERVSSTLSQARLGAAARAINLGGSFVARQGAQDRIEGRRLLLVDDVVTTGWTVAECARTLVSNGAAAVAVLCLARTPRLR
jgi:predicted amidophosphoribosyltransferase